MKRRITERNAVKIRYKNCKESGSLLLLLIVGTLAVVICGTVIYNIYKWAVRVSDGAPAGKPNPYTNGPNSTIPTPGNPGDITSMWWQDTSIQWYVDSGAPELASPLNTTETEKTNIIVYASLKGTNLLLKMSVQILTNQVDTMTFSELGMPVDAYGMPNDLSWSYGPLPDSSIPAQNWQLERSMNYIDWEPVTTIQVRPELTNVVCDPFTGNTMFYRATKIR